MHIVLHEPEIPGNTGNIGRYPAIPVISGVPVWSQERLFI